MQLTVEHGEEAHREERKMTTDSHAKGSSASQNRVKENASTIGRKRMSDEEFDREIVEMKIHLSVLMELLHENEEDQRYGWILRKRRVKWPMLQVKLKHRLSAWLRKELRETEYELRGCICEPKQGPILREESKEDFADNGQPSTTVIKIDKDVWHHIDTMLIKCDEGMTKEIPTNGMVGDSFMLEGRDIAFKEEMKLLEEWFPKDTYDEYCTKVANQIQVNSTDLDEELKFMEERLIDPKVHI